MKARPVTEVVAGVLTRADGAVLLADRPHGKAYAGYFELPGGKVEPNEGLQQALARELHEELGIDIGASTPWVVFEFDYPHAYVRLHFRRVRAWGGQLRAREGQRIGWHHPEQAPPWPLLPAAVRLIRWLRLPAVLPIDCDRATVRTPWGEVQSMRKSEWHREPASSNARWRCARINTAAEADQAAQLGFDFALLEPELTSARAPEWLGQAPLPLYAQASTLAQLETWQNKGAHGIVLADSLSARPI